MLLDLPMYPTYMIKPMAQDRCCCEYLVAPSHGHLSILSNLPHHKKHYVALLPLVIFICSITGRYYCRRGAEVERMGLLAQGHLICS